MFIEETFESDASVDSICIRNKMCSVNILKENIVVLSKPMFSKLIAAKEKVWLLLKIIMNKL